MIIKFLSKLLLALTISLGSLQAEKPNVVFIIVDDAGYADFGFMNEVTREISGNPTYTTDIPTPNLDALRNRGTLFSSAYTGSVCSPSRAAITTGAYGNRYGYELNIANATAAGVVDGHPNERKICFEFMKELGYTTGAIGKWHIGSTADPDAANGIFGSRPERQGVDEFLGLWGGSRNYTVGNENVEHEVLRKVVVDAQGDFLNVVVEKDAHLPNDPLPNHFSGSWNGKYLTTAFSDGAIDFIDRHHDAADPFFLYIAYTAPHGPSHESPDFNDPSIANLPSYPGVNNRRHKYASMMLTMDKEIGRVIDRLDDPNGDGDDSDSIFDNTLVFFINDNGGPLDQAAINFPLRGGKGNATEGGWRVPMIATGPGITAGATFDHPVHSIDMLPTAIGIGGGDASTEGFDGVDLLPFLDGTNSDAPHEVLIGRRLSNVSVRKGNWKLTRDANSGFRLYDLSTDINEGTNLAASNPAIVEELITHLRAEEVTWDKLRSTSRADNANDGFIANPSTPSGSPGGSFTADLTLVGGTVRNGDFNADTSSTSIRNYSETPNWTNVAPGGVQTQAATRTDSTFDDSRNAVLLANNPTSPNRQHGLDTEHTLATGEEFRAAYVWQDSGNWVDGTHKIRVVLYTTDNDTISGTPTEIEAIESRLSQVNGAYQSEEHFFAPIDAAHNGKRLFVTVHSLSNGGFARLDNFVLERGTLIPAPVVSEHHWHDTNGWFNADNPSQQKTLQGSTYDSFAGATLEFPSKSFNYRSENNATHLSGLEFMLNKLSFTGSETGSTEITGLGIQMTNDLDGNAPAIELDQTAGAVSIALDADLLFYHDLTITGDGTADFTLNTVLSELNTGLGITKTGSAKLTISQNLNHTGTTALNGGTLSINAGVTVQSPIVVASGATLEGNGSVNAAVSGAGSVAPGQSIGTMTVDSFSTATLDIELDGATTDKLIVTNNLDISGTTLNLTNIGAPASGVLIIAEYGSRTGTFTAITGLPDGYAVHYAYNDGKGSNNIALITELTIDQDTDQIHDLWEFSHFGDLTTATTTSDSDNNGQSDLLEFLAGTDPNLASSRFDITSSNSEGDTLQIDFHAIPGRIYTMEVSENLSPPWTTAGSLGPVPSASPQSLSAPIPEDSVKLFGRILIETPSP